MFCREKLMSFKYLEESYTILIFNHHDIRLRSRLTGHEWIVISPYDNSSCEILHRHSPDGPFHHQRGQYGSLSSALDYIRQHDTWFCEKKAPQGNPDYRKISVFGNVIVSDMKNGANWK